MAENEPRLDRPWVRRGGRRDRKGLARMLLILVLVFILLATNGFGALPDNPFSRALAETLGESLPAAVLEPFNSLLAGISQPAIVRSSATATESPTPSVTLTPTVTRTVTPSLTSSATPTLTSTATPTPTSTPTETATVTATRTFVSTRTASSTPTSAPTEVPTEIPTEVPTEEPTPTP